MVAALQVKGLKKSYGNIPVLKGIDFSVQQGEIFALLGMNGAGKTTALECIEGLRTYDDGKITIHGKTGIQLQSASLQAFIKPLEAVNLFSKWNKTKPDTKMLKTLGIYELSKKKYADLSMGQKRRLHLALALIGNPDIVFLDEPTASCIYTQKGNKKIRKPQAANQTALIFDRRAAARLLSINSIRRLCWS